MQPIAEELTLKPCLAEYHPHNGDHCDRKSHGKGFSYSAYPFRDCASVSNVHHLWQTENKGTWLSHVKDSIAALDADESGALEFPEFLILLTKEPWIAVIPEEARADFLKSVGQMEDQGKKAALDATRLARKLFEEADEDGSQTIEVEELRSLLEALLKRPVTLEEAKQSMLEFDADKSGALGFPEVVSMLATSPWRETLPPEARTAMPAVARSFQKAKKQQNERLEKQRASKSDDSFEFTVQLMTTMMKWKTDLAIRHKTHDPDPDPDLDPN